jgi:hypothetical protein
MDVQERDYLRQQIQELERSKGRWKLATIILAAALAIFLVVGGLSSLLFGMRQLRLRQDQLMMEMERDRAAEAEARLQAEQLRQAEAKVLKEKKEGGGAAGIQERDVGPRD